MVIVLGLLPLLDLRGLRLVDVQAFDADTVLVLDSKRPFRSDDPCVERGGTVAYDEKAASEATKAVKEFFRAVFKLEASALK